MNKNTKSIFLLLYFILSLFYMETLLRIVVNLPLFSLGWIISLLFSLGLSTLLYFVCSLFKPKINYFLSCFVFFTLGFVFASQFIYNDFFRTYYSLFSASNMEQILDFYKDILNRIYQNSIWLVLFFMPALILLIFGKKIFPFKKTTRYGKGLLVLATIVVYFSAVGIVHTSGKEQHSPYDLYYKNSYPILSVDRLGLITTMRLDSQRLLTGWTPDLEVSNPYLPEPTTEEPNEQKEEEPTIPDEQPHDNPGDTEKDPEDVEVIEEPVIVYNTFNIDFDALISQEENQEIIDMHEYFSSVPPTTQNDFTGKFEGYNLILITAEAFAPYAVNKDVTPTLYKMAHEGYQFTDYYVPLWDVSTSDGEYVGLTSLIPKSGVWSFYHSSNIVLPFVMGNQFNRLGYKTMAYHNHSFSYYRRDLSHPNMGYDYKGVGNGLTMKNQWPRSDFEMMEITVPEYIDDQPFHTYYLTVSGHLEYNFMGNAMASKNKKLVEHLPYSEPAKAYLATQIELDKAMEYLLDELENAGIADKTLIALSADHYPYGLEDHIIDELTGHKVEKNFELFKNTFILYTKGMEPVTIDEPSSSLDMIPTLSNLLGLEYDSRMLMGRDVFSDGDPLVILRNKSFITDKGRYNSVTKEFIPNPGVELDDGYIDRISSIIDSKFYYSTKILDTDYYSKISDFLPERP